MVLGIDIGNKFSGGLRMGIRIGLGGWDELGIGQLPSFTITKFSCGGNLSFKWVKEDVNVEDGF